MLILCCCKNTGVRSNQASPIKISRSIIYIDKCKHDEVINSAFTHSPQPSIANKSPTVEEIHLLIKTLLLLTKVLPVVTYSYITPKVYAFVYGTHRVLLVN